MADVIYVSPTQVTVTVAPTPVVFTTNPITQTVAAGAPGLPEGGSLNQVMQKLSGTDYHVGWTSSPTLLSVKFDTVTPPVVGVGEMGWNISEGTVDLGLVGGNVTLQVGQEEVVRILNRTGLTMTDLQVVRITGAQGNRLTAALAQANNETNSATSLAVVTEHILNNQQGFATRGGLVNNVDTSAFPEGAALWLSPTVAGGVTATKPVAPDHLVLVGWCVRQHATVGKIYVHIQNGYELDELHNVLVTAPIADDTILYDPVLQIWKNAPVRISSAVPASATATGTAGTVAYDAAFVYVCVATNTWRRVGLSIW